MATDPLNQLVIAIDQGSPYFLRLSFPDLQGYDDAVWRLRLSKPGATYSFYESEESDWTIIEPTTRDLRIDASITAAFAAGDCFYQLDVLQDSTDYPSFRAHAMFTNGSVQATLGGTAP